MIASQPTRFVIAGFLIAASLLQIDAFTIGSSLGVGKGGASSSLSVDPETPSKEGEKPNDKSTKPGSSTPPCPAHHAFPNGTRTRLAFFDCERNLPIHVLFAKIVNSKTKAPVYPYDKNIEQDLILHLTNKGPPINASKINIHIYEWSGNTSAATFRLDDEGCRWNEVNVPNRAKLLDNLDGCSLIDKCPLDRHLSIVKVPISQTFGQVIDQLDGGDIYQTVIRITAPDVPHEPLGCIVIQGLVKREH
jgi:hypothetical protein